MKTTIAIIAAFTLSGCVQLGDLLKLAPTPAQICAMSPATQTALAQTMGVTLETLTAACEIAG